MASISLLNANSVAVLSDTHLGAGKSILNLTQGHGMPRFSAFLKEHVPSVDTFILLGDILDLSLATYEQTVSSMMDLLAVLSKHCQRIVYVPGNHDHHIWLLANEHAEILQDFPSCKPGFSARADCAYEDAFLSRLIQGIPIQLCYPNVYWQPPRVQSRTYVFHHGHFCEDLYTLISDLYMQATDRHVATLNEVESINSGWLELLWYHLGQAGAGVGADGFVESLYEKLRAGDTSLVEQSISKIYKRKISPLLHSSLREWSRKHWYVSEGMADTIAGLIDRRAPGWIAGVIENYANREVAAGRVRASAMRGYELNDDLAQHCERYIDTWVRPSHPLEVGNNQVRLVFGHTHKGGVWPLENPRFFNLGGWILGPAEQWPSAYVMVISETGVLTTLTYGPDGTLGQSKVYPWS